MMLAIIALARSLVANNIKIMLKLCTGYVAGTCNIIYTKSYPSCEDAFANNISLIVIDPY